MTHRNLSPNSGRYRRLLAGIVLLLLIAGSMYQHAASAQNIATPKRDSRIQKAVDSVRKDRLETDVRALAAFPTRHTLSGASGADAAAAHLIRAFQTISQQTGGRLIVREDTWEQPSGNRLPKPTRMTNVLATLPGTEPNPRIVVISGHYDSRVTDVMDAKSTAPGANDDASGVAVVLEVARVLAPYTFPCTIVFAAVTGEEQGLYGSTHLAETLAATDSNVYAMVTNDIVGNSRGAGGIRDRAHLRIFSAGYDPTESVADAGRRRAAGTEGETPARNLSRHAAQVVREYIRGFSLTQVFRNDRYGRSGDHAPFVNRGYAACRFTEPNEDWVHQHQDIRVVEGVQYGDLPQFLDYEYLRHVARCNAAVIGDLAASAPPPTAFALKGDLSPQTTLSWVAPKDAVAVEVLARRTTSPEWEKSNRLPASATSIVLPLSKDDYLFGVRSVSETGARSLPAIPRAAR